MFFYNKQTQQKLLPQNNKSQLHKVKNGNRKALKNIREDRHRQLQPCLVQKKFRHYFVEKNDLKILNWRKKLVIMKLKLPIYILNKKAIR